MQIHKKKTTTFMKALIFNSLINTSQVEKLALDVYLCDIIFIALHTTGFEAEERGNISSLFAKVLHASFG